MINIVLTWLLVVAGCCRILFDCSGDGRYLLFLVDVILAVVVVVVLVFVLEPAQRWKTDHGEQDD